MNQETQEQARELKLVTYNPNGSNEEYEVLKPNPDKDNKEWQDIGKRYSLKGIRSLMQQHQSKFEFVIDESCLEGKA